MAKSTGIDARRKRKTPEEKQQEKAKEVERKKLSASRIQKLQAVLSTPVITEMIGESHSDMTAAFLSEVESFLPDPRGGIERFGKGSLILINTETEPKARQHCIIVHNGKYVVATLNSAGNHVYSNNNNSAAKEDYKISDPDNTKYVGCVVCVVPDILLSSVPLTSQTE